MLVGCVFSAMPVSGLVERGKSSLVAMPRYFIMAHVFNGARVVLQNSLCLVEPSHVE